MKRKTIIYFVALIIVNCQLLPVNCQPSTGSLLYRTNVELNLSTLNSATFNFGNGLLKSHPERSLNLNATVRILQHIEAGAVLSLQGTSPFGHSGTYPLSTANGVDYYYLGWDDNRYHLSGGVILQLHLNAFDKRFDRSNIVDLVLRGGWGLGGQVDGFWFGFGEEFRIARQLLWTISADYGGFPFATIKQVAENEIGWRFCTGLKISLK